MGNGCFCKSCNYIKDINLKGFGEKPLVNIKIEQILDKEEEVTDKKEKKISTIMSYFHQSGNELIKGLKKKDKIKKSIDGKRMSKIYDTIIDEKSYELMLKRLLAQKEIKRFGPKRRETTRGQNNIKNIVKEILDENKKEITASKNKEKSSNTNSSLIIKKKQQNKRGRFSVSYNFHEKNNDNSVVKSNGDNN